MMTILSAELRLGNFTPFVDGTSVSVWLIDVQNNSGGFYPGPRLEELVVSNMNYGFNLVVYGLRYEGWEQDLRFWSRVQAVMQYGDDTEVLCTYVLQYYGEHGPSEGYPIQLKIMRDDDYWNYGNIRWFVYFSYDDKTVELTMEFPPDWDISGNPYIFFGEYGLGNDPTYWFGYAYWDNFDFNPPNS
jgi:hypothetical protein